LICGAKIKADLKKCRASVTLSGASAFVSVPKFQDQVAYPPRAMRADRAAAYLDISRTLFLELVEEGKLPKARQWPDHDAPRWDRLELEAAWDDLNDDRKPARQNTIDKILGFDRNGTPRNGPQD
jgi:hypothetical protein